MAGQHENAIKDYETCLEMGSRYGYPLRCCAKSLVALGQLDKALAYLDKAIDEFAKSCPGDEYTEAIYDRNNLQKSPAARYREAMWSGVACRQSPCQPV